MIQKNKIEELKEILKQFTIEEVLNIERAFDTQFKALRNLYMNLTDKTYFCTLALYNALISYQLSGTGESYWLEFSEYFSKRKKIEDPVQDLIAFLTVSKFNSRIKAPKISRLEKLRILSDTIAKNELKYAENPKILQYEISRKLKSKPNSKTIVFSIKMFNYACRIKYNRVFILPFDINIPVDLRISRISKRLGIERNIEQFWNNIAQEVRIPPLHLDSLLWVTLGLLKIRRRIIDKKLNMLARFLITIL
ncbi:MAG: N-glycosylase/DNA lyase [Candidatus Njordarchaeia archaeon]